jgi:hypothetical protein
MAATLELDYGANLHRRALRTALCISSSPSSSQMTSSPIYEHHRLPWPGSGHGGLDPDAKNGFILDFFLS